MSAEIGLIHEDLTGRIIECGITVHRELGSGFAERFYEKALCIELELADLPFARQIEVPVMYRGEEIGFHRLDLVVLDKVVIELKAASQIVAAHLSQAKSCLVASGKRVALVLNFGAATLEIKRVVL